MHVGQDLLIEYFMVYMDVRECAFEVRIQRLVAICDCHVATVISKVNTATLRCVATSTNSI